MRAANLFLVVTGFTVTTAAQAIKYNYEYKCPETIIVRYCRNDSGPKVPEESNYCNVEYPDRPTAVPSIAFFDSVLYREIAAKVKDCKGPTASDPAIQKATTAKVDTVVFGIQLGDPFSIPACPLFQIGGAGTTTCYSTLASQTASTAAGRGSDIKMVYLAVDKCPSWVNECMLLVQSFEGKIGYIGVFTKGPNVDSTVREVLAEKYGKWSLKNDATVTPGNANTASFKITQYWWDLPGLYVHYQPVWSTADGETPNIREGLIRIETETARKTRLDAAAKAPKPKM